MSLFGSWSERGWLWNGWWKKQAGQHWCHQCLLWSAYNLVWLEAIHLSPVKSMWQQDGATAHCSLTTLTLLKRVIIIFWLSGVSWLLHFPVCNLYNFFLWGRVKLQVWRVKPASIHEFKTAMEDINVAILGKYICATAATIQKRCKVFLLADGDNFEHFLTSL